MDIEEWFTSGTGLKIKELRYLNPPPFPYILFVDSKRSRGADKLNNIIEHNITIELYSKVINEELEEKISNFLKSEELEFDDSRDWLNNEKLYCTSYDFIILEKERKKEYE